MTYTKVGFAKARVADYRERVLVEGTARDLRCIAGPLEEARSLMQVTMDAHPGAWLRWEQVNYSLGEARYEIVMPADA